MAMPGCWRAAATD